MAVISIAMNCPRCGGTLKFDEGAEMASCPYCSALLAIEGNEGEEGIRRVAFRDVIPREKAVEGVKEWWLAGSIPYDIKSKGRIEDPLLIYVPFWKLRATVVGLVCGTGYTWNMRKDDVEITILQERELTGIACQPAVPGIHSLENLDGETVPYDASAIPAFNVTDSETEVLASGLRVIEEDATRSTGITDVTFKSVEAIPVSLSILYYPIWIVKYTYSERIYFATVDGITGTVLAGRAPGSLFHRCFALALGMAAGGIGLAFCAWLVLTLPGSDGLPRHYTMDTLIPSVFMAGLIILVVYALLANVIYSFFRKETDTTRGYASDEYTLQELSGNASNATDNRKKGPYVTGEEQKP